MSRRTWRLNGPRRKAAFRKCPFVLTLIWAVSFPHGTVRADDELVQVEVQAVVDEPGNGILSGRILLQAEDGGILLEDTSGRYYNLLPERLVRVEKSSKTFTYLDAVELGRQLQTELGDGFDVVTTRHYVICTNTSKVYAQWCGALFERLHASFVRYWDRAGIELVPSRAPLAVVLFADRADFVEFARHDAGATATESLGYYSTRSNRTVLFDLTTGAASARTPREIVQHVSRSPFNIATVIHEATHQIAFNSGMHRRFSDNPVWLTEGMAMFFETPDLTSRAGWRSIGQENPFRLAQLTRLAASEAEVNLTAVVSSDALFIDPDSAVDAYAVTWALTSFLVKTRRRNYVDYVQMISEKQLLQFAAPDQRLAEFEQHFGKLDELQPEFIRYLNRMVK